MRDHDADFRELRQISRTFGAKKMLLGVGSFLLYVLLSCFAPALMDLPVLGHITVGFVLGLLQFVIMAAIARLHAVHMRTEVEPLVDQLREEREEAEKARQTEEQGPIPSKIRYRSW
ncbi:MAG: DUF485 domain-containing protein [Streptomycetaceae bacterium]|nr:DUF485 domain-containing protein [Streptomycetaceae bacterium]